MKTSGQIIREKIGNHPDLLHLPLRDVAPKFEVAYETMRKWLNGGPVRLKNATKVAEVLGCSVSEILPGRVLTANGLAAQPVAIEDALEVVGKALAKVPVDRRPELASLLQAWVMHQSDYARRAAAEMIGSPAVGGGSITPTSARRRLLLSILDELPEEAQQQLLTEAMALAEAADRAARRPADDPPDTPAQDHEQKPAPAPVPPKKNRKSSR